MQNNNLSLEKLSQNDDEKVQDQLNLLQQEFNKLSNQQKIQKGLEITRNLINSKAEQEIVIPDDVQSFTLLSIDISPFPTESRKIMKYIQTDQLQKFIDKNFFVEVDNYCVVFANVEDLSYHNFENILNLDHLFNTTEFNIKTKKQFGKKVQIFNMEGSMDTLLSLDRLNYYTVPLNSSQRGGKRLIFHSNQLSFSLTKMIEESDFFDKKNFSHVNNVFRLNNFAPGDKKFKSHYDTPFADNQNNLYSKYTIIIYLSGNSVIKKDQPPLKIKNIVLNQIKENECIIFDQKYEHEGNAYPDQDKIFIRTELIYKIKNMDYDEKVARMFNTACYMTKEPDQQQYSADLFNSCVKMRYRISEEVQRVYLMKQNLNVMYVTDGNYYWFPKDIELKSIGMLIILDYFNGKVYDLKNIKIKSKPLPRKNTKSEEESDENIFNFIEMSSFTQQEIDKNIIKNYQNTEDFVPDSLCKDFTTFECDCSLGDGETETAIEYFEPEKSKVVKQLNGLLDENTVLIFDNMIKINYKDIKIQIDDEQNNGLSSGKLLLSDFFINTQKKINFASCQCEHYYNEEDIISFERKSLFTFCLPDISFQKFSNGIKLSIDMFNNGFVHYSTNTFDQPYADENKISENRRNREDSNDYDDVDDDDVDDDEEDDEEEDEDDIDDIDEDVEADLRDDNEVNNDGLDDKKCLEEDGVNSKEKKQNNKIRAEFEECTHQNIKLAKN